MSRTEENFILFLFGGVLYSLIEILFRGVTHWSMTITGGIWLGILYRQFTNKPDSPLFLKCLFGSAVITGFEFAVGCIVNLILDWNVWDYSSHPLNLMGQICPFFFGIMVFADDTCYMAMQLFLPQVFGNKTAHRDCVDPVRLMLFILKHIRGRNLLP